MDFLPDSHTTNETLLQNAQPSGVAHNILILITLGRENTRLKRTLDRGLHMSLMLSLRLRGKAALKQLTVIHRSENK